MSWDKYGFSSPADTTAFKAHSDRDARTAVFIVDAYQVPIGSMPYVQPVLVNPTTFSERWEPQYARRGTLGSSQEILQYIRTNTREISIDLWISWQIYLQTGWAVPEKGPLFFRDFFAALTMPVAARSVPPTVELDWPGARLSFKGVISAISFDYERFTEDGTPVEYTIRLQMVEHSTRLRTTRKVYAEGLGYLAEEG